MGCTVSRAGDYYVAGEVATAADGTEKAVVARVPTSQLAVDTETDRETERCRERDTPTHGAQAPAVQLSNRNERGRSVDDGAIAALPHPAQLLSPPNANVLERRAALGSLFSGLPEPEAEPQPQVSTLPGACSPVQVLPRATAERVPAATQPGPDAVITLLRSQKQELPASAPFHAFLRRPRLCRKTVTVEPADEAPGDNGVSPLLGRLPPELLLDVLGHMQHGASLCRAASTCRKLHHAIYAPENDRILWRPISIDMAADGMYILHLISPVSLCLSLCLFILPPIAQPV